MTEILHFPSPRRDLCAAMQIHRQLLNESITYRAQRARIENRALQYKTGRRRPLRKGVVTIPVVVHVVHNPRNPEQNIDDQQIHSQIDVLNRDYRAANPDVSQVPDVWRSLVADAQIEFRLATTDPLGNPTDGIVRVETDRRFFPAIDETVSPVVRDPVKSAATGGADPWPSDQYLNLWVCQLDGEGLLGYAQFPGGPPQTDGVVILHSAFGTTGTATFPFDGGRTATHEIGHWLDLFHIWGDDDGACGNDDRVSDTPNQADHNRGTPAFPHITCDNGPNGDMFMNYMDYVDDRAMFMFTLGQKERMDACLEGARASFLVSQLGRAPAPAAQPAAAPPAAAQPPAAVPAGATGTVKTTPTGDGEVERMLHDTERLTTELLNEIRGMLGVVSRGGHG